MFLYHFRRVKGIFRTEKRSLARRGRYSLSTRALLELLSYLKSAYPEEVLECTICQEVIYYHLYIPLMLTLTPS